MLITVFIAASIAITVVFGQTGFLTGYSGEVQNRSKCDSLEQQADSQYGDPAAQEYREMGCQEIYGAIDPIPDSPNNGITKMEGISIGQWPADVIYDSTYEYNYEIDFSELDGQEYLSEWSGTDWGGEFEYNPDYYYTIGFKVNYPTESGGQSNVKQWGGDVGNFCHGEEVCSLNNTFTYSEPGNLSDGDLMPCQDTSGNQSDFNQKIFLQAYEERNNGDFDSWQGRVTIMNQSLELRDPENTPCWTEGANPTFDDGKVIISSIDFPSDFRIDQEQEISTTVDISNNPRNVTSLDLWVGYPNGTTGTADYGTEEYLTALGEVEVDEDCENVCTLETTVDLSETETPPCSADDIDQDQITLTLRERFDEEDTSRDSPIFRSIESSYAQDEYSSSNQFIPRCWMDWNIFP